jgi:uncharacterized Zn finger protein (UPF0148 family)
MTERICRRCGGDLTKGARFCARCGEVVSVASSHSLHAPENVPLTEGEAEQTVPPQAAPAEEMPAILTVRQEQEK